MFCEISFCIVVHVRKVIPFLVFDVIQEKGAFSFPLELNMAEYCEKVSRIVWESDQLLKRELLTKLVVQ